MIMLGRAVILRPAGAICAAVALQVVVIGSSLWWLGGGNANLLTVQTMPGSVEQSLYFG